MQHRTVWCLSVTLVLAITGLIFLWLRLKRSKAAPDVRMLAAIESGLLVLWIAAGSPLAQLDHEWLTAHMVQHLLIMTVGAPLLIWGVRTMPRVHIGVHPVVCWLAGTGVVTGWHIPAIFDLGMSSAVWHGIEQGSFLVAGLLFWLPVMEPWAGGKSRRWSVPLYLFLATLPCDALSAFLTFCGHVVYGSYRNGPGLPKIAALLDQSCAGALMWVWVTFAYLFPAVGITLHILSPRVRSSQPEVSRLKAA